MSAKYELLPEDTITTLGVTLFRIRALVAIGTIAQPGDLGGYVENEKNLSQTGDAWVYGDARVYGDAWVSGNAWVSGVLLTATRSDGYNFALLPTPDGPRISAGCRYFSFDEADTNWQRTRAGTPLGDETFSILAHLRRMAEIHGLLPSAGDAQ